jgi:hypothetical protein
MRRPIPLAFRVESSSFTATMSIDHIRYDLLVQDALRGVVRKVLIDTQKHGLSGEHHFYVSFKTAAAGVRLSSRMRAQYPDEMTIVLQHQFWDLNVTEHAFEVGLSFGGVPERLLVPFEAIVGFFDPSVQFGLKFEVAEPDTDAINDDEQPAEGATAPEAKRKPSLVPVAGAPVAAPAGAALPALAPPPADGGRLSAPARTKSAGGKSQPGGADGGKGREAPAKGSPVRGAGSEPDALAPPAEPKGAPAKGDTAASVVSLDAFRKKK